MLARYEIDGNKPLTGTISCSGAKNAALPLLAAALLADGKTVIHKVPDLMDIRTMMQVIRYLGAETTLTDNVLTIDSSQCGGYEAPYELVRKMRASFYVMGPLLARYKRAKVSLPGGCALGPRPVDLHLKAFTQMGCDIEVDGGYVIAKADRLKGCSIYLDIASVGATGNIMMAAVGAEGETVIENAACEPDIVDLANLMIAMGADIRGAGTPTIRIAGGTPLKPVEYTVIPDRIEAGTFLIAAFMTAGYITLTDCRPDHMRIVLEKLQLAGATIETTENSITLDGRYWKIQPVDVISAVYPGFPTDLQPLWSALMCLADGDSVVTDNIYPDRFTHIPELTRLGARVRQSSNSAIIRGVEKLKGAGVMCSDIRGAAGIITAALAAHGRSDVLRVYHLDRGYERMENKITALGGNIRRILE